MARALRLAFVAALGATPLVMHAALGDGRLVPAAAVAAGLQGYAAGLALPWRNTRRAAAIPGMALAATVLCFPMAALLAWPGVLNAMIYCALLSRFTRSLAPGQEPVVTRIARLARGMLAPEVVRYTRRVTIAWCVFFAGQLVLSALLLAILPRSQWLWFVTLCNLPMVGVMFLGEYVIRLIVLRHHQHEGPGGFLHAFSAVRAGLARGRVL